MDNTSQETARNKRANAPHEKNNIMIELKLHRKQYTDKQTIGVMEVWKDGIFKFAIATLELDWNGNSVSSSCIPKGVYKVKPYSSKKYPNALELLKVPNRTNILIHNGAFFNHTLGCILTGFVHADINNDGYQDVTYSRKALEKLVKFCKGHEINITIT